MPEHVTFPLPARRDPTMNSPCRTCDRRNADKNHPLCVNCPKRRDYVLRSDEDRFVRCGRAGSEPLSAGVSTFLRRPMLSAIME
jgi:hypothetical protein